MLEQSKNDCAKASRLREEDSGTVQVRLVSDAQ